MLIEFIGAAGVGKSYLSGKVLEQLSGSGVVVGDFDLLEIRKADPRNLLLAARAVLLAMAIRPKGRAEFMHAVRVISSYSIRRALCEKSEGVYLTSEGLFHRLISLHRRSKVSGMAQLARMLFRHIRPSDIVVVVEASPEKIYERRFARRRARDVFTRESVREDVTAVENTFEVMLDIQRTLSPGMRIVKVAAEEDGETGVVDIIMATLNRGTPSVHA